MLEIGAALERTGIPIDDLGLSRPTLDDVFLHLTGHRAEEAPEGDLDELDHRGGPDHRGDHREAEVAS